MQSWTKTFASLTLLCYISVSSIASVHAFPSALKSASSLHSSSVNDNDSHVESLNADLTGMSPDCHGQTGSETETKSNTACAIFCATMSSLIVDQVKVNLPSNAVESMVEFLFADFKDYAFELEPRPPK